MVITITRYKIEMPRNSSLHQRDENVDIKQETAN